MPRLVLPGGRGGSVTWAPNVKHRHASGFIRFIGGCWLFSSGPPERGLAPDLAPGEIMVGHENFYRPGNFCWLETDWAYRGAVRFPLTARDVTAGFHKTEQAWLTWRRVSDPRSVPFLRCTQALVQLGRAASDWRADITGFDGLAIAGTPIALTDDDATIPRSSTPHLRRVEVTEIVRDWVERGNPNFGFVLQGDGTFARPPASVTDSAAEFGGSFGEFGLRWEGCLGIYTGFELVFSNTGYIPSYGRLAADL
jgi:hypothetical protein